MVQNTGYRPRLCGVPCELTEGFIIVAIMEGGIKLDPIMCITEWIPQHDMDRVKAALYGQSWNESGWVTWRSWQTWDHLQLLWKTKVVGTECGCRRWTQHSQDNIWQRPDSHYSKLVWSLLNLLLFLLVHFCPHHHLLSLIPPRLTHSSLITFHPSCPL